MSASSTAALPYHDPDIVTILILSSFLLLLNLVNHLLDNIIFCGLLGQVLVGVTWGTPGAKWLNVEAEEFIVRAGYLGLILLVFEGGLSTSFRSMKANAFLSAAVATTGIALPIALAFSLKTLAMATPLQSFAAGAALCSTSLGTIFTILNTSGLTTTRLGTVLTSAAMMDDVVGLIMVQVISNLGGSDATFNSITIIRPIAVSVGLVLASLLACRFLIKPTTPRLYLCQERLSDGGILCRVFKSSHTAFLIHTGVLIGFVTGATYAGTSNLYAAYLAGASISWWDSEIGHVSFGDTKSDQRQVAQGADAIKADSPIGTTSRAVEQNPRSRKHQLPQCVQPSRRPLTGKLTYECYYLTVVDRILKPCFFASIGFSIPITQMFSAAIVWRGMVFTILMLFSKLLTGFWLVRFYIPWPKASYTARLLRPATWCCWSSIKSPTKTSHRTSTHFKSKKAPPSSSLVPENAIPMTSLQTGQASTPKERHEPQSNSVFASPSMGEEQEAREKRIPSLIGSTPTELKRPRSLYPAAILGSAMTARGEIGFLIASLAESKGIFAASYSSPADGERGSSSEIYLIVVWAIVLCTVVGPISVGMLVKRVRRLQRSDERKNTGGIDPLGIWGVI